jgi:CBS domain-containing protein
MLTVRDVMTTSVITVHPTDPVKDVAHLLVDRRISGVPVVSPDGVVVGVVSEADFLVKEGGPADAPGTARRLLHAIAEHTAASERKLRARTAGDLMTAPAITIGPRRPIAEAARAMSRARVNRLPVVDGGRIVGIVTRADLLRAFTRSDEQLATTIREDVLLRALWLDPARFTVRVVDGVAMVHGDVERRSTADLVCETVALVPGIIDVEASIAWSVDDCDRPSPAEEMALARGFR